MDEFDSLVKQSKITLLGKELTDSSLPDIVKVLQKGNVEELNMMMNQITLQDDTTFTTELATNTTLKVLSLLNNQISNVGAKNLSKALMKNTTLECLILRGNCIGDEGAVDIATSFLFNDTLKVVLLGENNITNVGGEKLAETIAHNSSLNQVLVDSNPNMNVDIMQLKINNVLSMPSRKSSKGGSGSDVLPKDVVMKQLSSKDDIIATKDTQLHSAQVEIATLKAQLQSKDNQCNIHISELNKTQEELTTKNANIYKLNATINSLNADLVCKDQLLACKNTEIDLLKSTIDNPLELLCAYISNKDDEIRELNDKVDLFEKEMAAAQAAAKEAAAAAAAAVAKEEVEEKRDEAAAADTEIINEREDEEDKEVIKAALEAATASLDPMMDSLSIDSSGSDDPEMEKTTVAKKNEMKSPSGLVKEVHSIQVEEVEARDEVETN